MSREPDRDAPTGVVTTAGDDIDALRGHLGMPQLAYRAIAEERQRAAILAAWPLLAELEREAPWR